jgi:hypothetical protein
MGNSNDDSSAARMAGAAAGQSATRRVSCLAARARSVSHAADQKCESGTAGRRAAQQATRCAHGTEASHPMCVVGSSSDAQPAACSASEVCSASKPGRSVAQISAAAPGGKKRRDERTSAVTADAWLLVMAPPS